jgi:membrane-associated protease RseP (regulator of RpoE activity)
VDRNRISIGLIGLIGLFPIHLLNGGHLLFYRTQEIGFRIGLAVVLMLMMFATWNDLGIVRRWLTGIG